VGEEFILGAGESVPVIVNKFDGVVGVVLGEGGREAVPFVVASDS
jgi:hypothetical protein